MAVRWNSPPADASEPFPGGSRIPVLLRARHAPVVGAAGETTGAHRVVGGAEMRWYTPASLLSELLRSTSLASAPRGSVVGFPRLVSGISPNAPLSHVRCAPVHRSTYRRDPLGIGAIVSCECSRWSVVSLRSLLTFELLHPSPGLARALDALAREVPLATRFRVCFSCGRLTPEGKP